MGADNILINLKNVLKARAFYNPVFQVISYGEDSDKKMFEYLSNQIPVEENRFFREINSQTKPIVNFPTFYGRLYLQNMRGYAKI